MTALHRILHAYYNYTIFMIAIGPQNLAKSVDKILLTSRNKQILNYFSLQIN